MWREIYGRSAWKLFQYWSISLVLVGVVLTDSMCKVLTINTRWKHDVIGQCEWFSQSGNAIRLSHHTGLARGVGPTTRFIEWVCSPQHPISFELRRMVKRAVYGNRKAHQAKNLKLPFTRRAFCRYRTTGGRALHRNAIKMAAVYATCLKYTIPIASNWQEWNKLSWKYTGLCNVHIHIFLFCPDGSFGDPFVSR